MHPILFHIGNFPVGTYGVMIVIGMMAGLWLAARLARRRGLRPEFFYDLAFVLLICGFVGARLFTIFIESPAEFRAHPLQVIFSRQGFTFQGGFIAALAAGIYYTFRRKVPLLEAADIVAPALVLAHAFGRIGCFLAGCCYGRACPPGEQGGLLHALAVQYPLLTENGRPIDMFNFAYIGQLREGLIAPMADAPLPIIPVQLFESLGNFIICAILVWQWRRRRVSGQTFALYLILYSLLRFGVEYLRGDPDRGVYWGGAISTAQIICIFTFLAAFALWWARRDKGFQPISAEARIPDPDEASNQELSSTKPPVGASEAGRPARRRHR